MKGFKTYRRGTSAAAGLSKVCAAVIFLFLLTGFGSPTVSLAQAPNDEPVSEVELPGNLFRVEHVPVAGGAELITIRARLDGLTTDSGQASWIPVVSVLRDSLAMKSLRMIACATFGT